MEFAVAAIVLIYSVVRGWQNAIFPFVLICFLNTFEWWLRLRNPFFFQHQEVLDIFFVVLLGFCLVRHALPDLKQHMRLNKIQIALILVVAYSWLSYTWSPGAEIVQRFEPDFVKHYLVWGLISLLLLPMAFQAGLGKHGIERDFTVVGLTVLPLVALTTEWQNRGATYLFYVNDPETGQLMHSANPLNISVFAVFMIIFAVCYMRSSLRSILTLGVVMGLGFYLLIETQARGQMFACLLVLAIIPIYLRPTFRTRHLLVLGPLILLPLAAVALNIGTIIASILEVAGFPEAYSLRVSGETISQDIGVRFTWISQVWEHWSKSPSAILFGLGTASSYTYAGSYIHNIIIEVLFEQGIIIFMLFMYVVVGTLAAIAVMLDINGLTDDDKRLAVFFSALYVVLLIISLKQGAFYNSPNLLMITVLCTILAEHLKRKYSVRNAPMLGPLVQESGVNSSSELPQEM